LARGGDVARRFAPAISGMVIEMINYGIDGRVAVVTGINNPLGIGAAISRALIDQGVSVFGTYYRGEAPGSPGQDALGGVPGLDLYRALDSLDASLVLDDLSSAGGNAVAVEVDLSDKATPGEVMDAAEREFGPVEMIILNAAVDIPDTLLPADMAVDLKEGGGLDSAPFDPDAHDRHFHVNVRSAALFMQEMARRNHADRRDWGRVVTISTDASANFPAQISYASSKHAVESLTRSAASELGQFGITVNCVSPGPVQTGYIPPGHEERIAVNTPVGRDGWPEEVADVVAFLCSEQARHVTGQLIYVGGGHKMPGP
jgi:3-oxoacyl-[acyl-carrier protein] reductase